MSRIKRSIYIFNLLILCFSFSAESQVSLVPANHPVYEWLHRQRVLGNAPIYNYEALPLSRGHLVKIIEAIDDQSLGNFDKKLKGAYWKEFSVENLKNQKNTLFQGESGSFKDFAINKTKLFLTDDEFHFYSRVDSSSNLAVDGWWGQGVISSSNIYTTTTRGNGFRTISPSSTYNFLGLRFYGSLYENFGFHLDYQNVTDIRSRQALAVHPEYGNTWHPKTGKSSTFYAQAFASAQYGKLRFDIGRGMLRYGISQAPLLVRRTAPDFDWIRLTWKSKFVDYDYLHGSLQSLGTQDTTFNISNQSFNGRLRVDRWFVMRRLTVRPTNWLSFAYSQTTIYSSRGVDLAHLNPILPAEVTELNSQDLDNPSLYFDMLVRPFPNLEIHAGLSADDINKRSDIFRKTGNRSSEDGVFAYQVGANFSYKTGTDIGIEYSQLDPFYYTHIFRFNTYENFNESIGASFGPNADRLHLTARQWLPKRAFVQVSLSNVRRGENILDADGDLSRDVGGDLLTPQGSGDLVRFLDGNLVHYQELEIRGQVEPVRALRISFLLQKRMVTQGVSSIIQDNSDYAELSISLGY